MDDRPGIPLASAIEDLRSELLRALEAGIGEKLHFRLKPIELELQVAVTATGAGKGGVKFWVVEFGVEGGAKRETTHKLKLTLEPVGPHGESFEVSASESLAPRIG
jgi:hypothetical protein